MGGFVGILISKAHQRGIRLALLGGMFALLLLLGTGAAALLVQEGLRAEASIAIAPFAKLRSDVDAAFDALEHNVTATPCGPQFREQMRRVAYMPDGISEFLYAPDGVVQCASSMGTLASPEELGAPDLSAAEGYGLALWFDRDLDFLGLIGLSGTIGVRDGFGLVIPQQGLVLGPNPWVKRQVVLRTSTGRWWHRSGEPGIYAAVIAGTTGVPDWWPLRADVLQHLNCDADGLHCIATRTTIGDIVSARPWALVGAVLLCLFTAWWLSGLLHAALRRFWSFEARFLRHFNAETIICTYQPIMDLATGRISGCEVLVRWRDLDDRVIFPDQFLPIVERRGLTLELTRFVVERAYAELSAAIPNNRRLRVNFNIFPCDLAADTLVGLLSPFLAADDRFDTIVEIVESTAVSFDTASQQICRLRHAGVGVYLDDFGTGFSNIRHLALLPLDGVKIDREFAMSAEESLMGQMLPSVLDMVHRAGRTIVVEGVESADRLATLRALGGVDHVQGYHVARPLEIARFVAFLGEHDVSQRRPRLVA